MPGRIELIGVYFIHEWQVGQPLLTSYGSLTGAQPVSMPERFIELVRYELVD